MLIDRLITRIAAMDNPSVVGLDPRPEYMPAFIVEAAFARHEDACLAMSEAIYDYNRALIDSLYDVVPAVKPQIAFYEMYGPYGMEAYRRTVCYAKEKGMLVIGDIKRGDIASTAQAYADAHIGRVAVRPGTPPVPGYDADFVTLNPYLGRDAVTPFIQACRDYDKGLFLLVRTSNPGAADLQDLMTPEGAVYEAVARMVSDWGDALPLGEHGYSPVGAVVGATYPEQAKKLRAIMPRTFFLVPGYGAQGGTAADVRACFDKDGGGAIVNNARGIIAAYKQPAYQAKFTEANFADAAREAALRMKADLRAVL